MLKAVPFGQADKSDATAIRKIRTIRVQKQSHVAIRVIRNIRRFKFAVLNSPFRNYCVTGRSDLIKLTASEKLTDGEVV